MYLSSHIITKPLSNNRLDYERRTNYTIIIPSLIEGNLDDVRTSENIVIECDVNGQIVSGKGLEHFVFLKNARVPTWIMDNHNHAFYFWHEALSKGWIQKGSLLVHIDQHTDLGTPLGFKGGNGEKGKWGKGNEYLKNPDHLATLPSFPFNLQDVYEYTNSVLTIADFIVPALENGTISEALMVTGEERTGAGFFRWNNGKLVKRRTGKEIIKNPNHLANSPFNLFPSMIVDLDLDYFAQGFDETKAMETVKYWIQRADIITIATSPLFIQQEEALRILKSLQKDLEAL